jgi:hypothetical protein
MLVLNCSLNHHLLLEGCVAIRFKMLTYKRVRTAFETDRALPSSKIEWLRKQFYLVSKQNRIPKNIAGISFEVPFISFLS